jgi:hypothetical protein
MLLCIDPPRNRAVIWFISVIQAVFKRIWVASPLSTFREIRLISEASSFPVLFKLESWMLPTALVFANIIGNNLGPHFFPIGSLAILMWLNTMKRKGLNIRLVDYLRVGSVLSIVEVFAAAVILWAEINLLHWTLAFS